MVLVAFAYLTCGLSFTATNDNTGGKCKFEQLEQKIFLGLSMGKLNYP